MNLISLILVAFMAAATHCVNMPCVSKDFGKSSTVCVCNSTYCDTNEELSDIAADKFVQIVTSKAGKRFETTIHNIGGQDDGRRTELFIERRLQYQKMIGFGGAFTDATGINMLKLSKALQDNIISAYFGKDGLEYSIARVPIGGADFSDRPYSLCDLSDPTGTDPNLENFALQNDDRVYKIPFIKEAQKLKPDLKLFASPWSPPMWMKSNYGAVTNFTGFSRLKPEFYKSYANYFIRFLEEYKKNDVEFWAITPQNEPTHGLLITGEWNSMGWTPMQQKTFVMQDLGPTIRGSEFNKTKIIMMDDQRFSVVEWAQTILGDPQSAQYVDGIGLHWYANTYVPPFPLNVAHNEFPDYFMLNTEACTGFLHFLPGIDPVVMGSWERAELYAHNIIEDLNHWLTGWVEWNLILDMTGGPNWAGNQVDAPIIVNTTAGEAYKQPMYYAMGHFSKYVTENSIRISHSGKELKSLEVLSVLRPDNKIVLVVYNSGSTHIRLKIRDSLKAGNMFVDILPNSINTIAYAVEDEGAESTTTAKSTKDAFSATLTLLCLLFVGLMIKT